MLENFKGDNLEISYVRGEDPGLDRITDHTFDDQYAVRGVKRIFKQMDKGDFSSGTGSHKVEGTRNTWVARVDRGPRVYYQKLGKNPTTGKEMIKVYVACNKSGQLKILEYFK